MGDGTYVKPCRIATFTITTAGTLSATLTWPEGDLDLTLWREGSLVTYSRGFSHTETVRATVSPGDYELRVSYFAGIGTANFTLQVSSPGGTTPALTSGAPPSTGVTRTETFTGSISGTESACNEGTVVRPCRVIALAIGTGGSLRATLTWSETADLDLFLWRGATRVASSAGVTRTETITANVSSGDHEFHITYFGGGVVANYTLAVTRPN